MLIPVKLPAGGERAGYEQNLYGYGTLELSLVAHVTLPINKNAFKSGRWQKQYNKHQQPVEVVFVDQGYTVMIPKAMRKKQTWN